MTIVIEMDKAIIVLNKKRGAVKHKLTSFKTFVESIKNLCDEDQSSIEPQQWVELDLRIIRYENLLGEFEELQSEIEIATSDESMMQQFAERESFEENYFKVMSVAKELLSHRDLNDGLEDSSNVSHQSYRSSSVRNVDTGNIKLPTIELPKFNGSFEKWLEFKDTFESLIHSNNKLVEIQKYHYLRASLQGSASQVIEALEFSSENYKVAWEAICNRFDNKNLLVYNHIKELFSMPMLTKEAVSVRALVDSVAKHLRCLNILNINTESWDPLLIYMMSTKLDRYTLSEWERQRANQVEFPTLNEMKEFLKRKADFLETLEHREQGVHGAKAKNSRGISLLTNEVRCNNCHAQHVIYDCPEFLKLSINQRIEKAKKERLCLNCLRTGHFANRCFLRPCKVCNKRHNSLLHNKPDTKEQQRDGPVALSARVLQQHVLLSTAQVLIKDNGGTYKKCRAILDSGSQSNFIREDLVSNLQLPKKNANINIMGINKVSSKITAKCNIKVKSIYNNYNFELKCFILPTISEEIPSQPVNSLNDENINKLPLADPEFHKPGKIDLLIGAEVFWDLLINQTKVLGKNKPILHNSKLGWIVSGNINTHNQMSRRHCNLSIDDTLDKQLKRFWEIEEVPVKPQLSKEEIQCEDNFRNTTTRQADGRFTVTIPLKESLDKLGDSKNVSLKRLYGIERKFQRDEQFKIAYLKFMQDYEETGHMKRIDVESYDDSNYLPHHGVMNVDSTTTKLRVVFDASAATTSGWSFNDLQAVGPTIQDDLFAILIRFRQHKYVLAADVRQMYRQVDIAEHQRYLQRILWRFNPVEPISTYELKTVTYGTASGPFLAIRCLHQLAIENEPIYPLASAIIKRDFYVDDLLTGGETLTELRTIYNDISAILKQGKMELRKWKSNNEEINTYFEEDKRDSITFDPKPDNYSKTLGVKYSHLEMMF